MNPARLNFTDVQESSISKEVAPGFDFLAQTYHTVTLAEMPQPPFGSRDWARVNFEFIPNLVALPGPEELQSALKAIEIREIRGRGAAKRSTAGAPGPSPSMKLGVFAAEDLDPGVLVTEYVGQVQVVSQLALPKKQERTMQSHVLFIPRLKPVICVDARRQGNIARHIRRSCRPNCEVKMVLSGGDEAEDVHVCVFSRNSVQEGDELFLPIDFDDGNTFYRYECACGNQEHCLAPEGAQPLPRPRPSASIDAAMVDSTHILRPAPTQLRAKTPTAPLVSALAAGAPPARLSREERKMMQYIEQIDRMDTAGKKSASRKSSSGMASSASTMAVGGQSESPSAKASPTRQDAAPSSPQKRKSEADAITEEELEEHEDLEDTNKTVVEPSSPLPERTERVEKKEMKAKEPKQPKTTTKAAKVVEPKPAKKAKKAKVESPPESILEEEPEGPTTPLTSSPRKPKLGRIFMEDEAMHVDVVRSDERPSYASSTPPPRPDTAEGSPVGSGSERETPSKKRVSLSDYMKKRRATDPNAREEGELPAPPPEPLHYQPVPRPSTVDRPAFLDEHSGTGVVRSSSGRFYEMPPHLTPPPPLASHPASVLDMRVAAETYSVPPRSESVTSVSYAERIYGEPPRSDKDRSLDPRHPERKDYGASKYGYSGRESSYPSRAQEAHHQVYRPRPSLLKAAQDLPTRWEEQSRGTADPHRPTDPYHRDHRPSSTGLKREFDDSYRRGHASGSGYDRRSDEHLGGPAPREGPPPPGPLPPHRKPSHNPHWKRPGAGSGPPRPGYPPSRH